LTPRREARQRVVSWNINAPGRRTEHVDAHGNVMHYLTLETPHRELRVVVSGVVETDDTLGQLNGESSVLSPLAYRTATPLTSSDAQLDEFARASWSGAQDVREKLLQAADAVCNTVAYQPGVTMVTDTAVVAFQRGEGVCQDQAHVFLACCRSLGLSVRYVSGYLHTQDVTAVASHAWVEAWLESEQKWFGIDVTNRRPTGSDHCRLAVGRDYLDAAPVRGVRRGGGLESMHVEVLVAVSQQQ
jgi:transglutaminase-like putative cysteine protease